MKRSRIQGNVYFLSGTTHFVLQGCLSWTPFYSVATRGTKVTGPKLRYIMLRWIDDQGELRMLRHLLKDIDTVLSCKNLNFWIPYYEIQKFMEEIKKQWCNLWPFSKYFLQIWVLSVSFFISESAWRFETITQFFSLAFLYYHSNEINLN